MNDVQRVEVTWHTSSDTEFEGEFALGESYTATVKVTLRGDTTYEFDGNTKLKVLGADAEKADFDGNSGLYATGAHLFSDLHKTYDVVTNVGEGGESATASARYGEQGTQVTLAAVAKPGYKFKEWAIEKDESKAAKLEDNKLTIGSSDVELKASFQKETYSIKKDEAQNGTITVNESAQYMDNVVVTAKPDRGYKLQKLSYVTEDGKETDITNTGSFTMPASDLTVKAFFEKETSKQTYKVNLNCVPEGVYGCKASASPLEGSEGTEVILTATPDVGSVFAGWQLVQGDGAKLNGDRLILGSSDVTVNATFKPKNLPKPEMSKHRTDGKEDRGSMAVNTVVELTITQVVPENATYLQTVFDLVPEMHFVSRTEDVVVEEAGGKSPLSAKVRIDGQKLTVTLDDAALVGSLKGKTIVIKYLIQGNDDGDFSKYITADISASVPYQATTYFDAESKYKAVSDVNMLKYSVSSKNRGGESSSSGSSSYNSTAKAANTNTASTSTLAKTGDCASVGYAALSVLAGASAVIVGKSSKRD